MAKEFKSPDNNSNWWNKFPNRFVQEDKEKFGCFSDQSWNYTRTKWFTWISAHANEKRRNIVGNEPDDFGISITKNSCFVFSTSENEFKWNPKYGWKCSRRDKYDFKRDRTSRFGIWTQKRNDYLADNLRIHPAEPKNAYAFRSKTVYLLYTVQNIFIRSLRGQKLILHKCSFHCPSSIWLLKIQHKTLLNLPFFSKFISQHFAVYTLAFFEFSNYVVGPGHALIQFWKTPSERFPLGGYPNYRIGWYTTSGEGEWSNYILQKYQF